MKFYSVPYSQDFYLQAHNMAIFEHRDQYPSFTDIKHLEEICQHKRK